MRTEKAGMSQVARRKRAPRGGGRRGVRQQRGQFDIRFPALADEASDVSVGSGVDEICSTPSGEFWAGCAVVWHTGI